LSAYIPFAIVKQVSSYLFEWKQNSDAYYKVFESIKERIT
jgi:hypothetical protein